MSDFLSEYFETTRTVPIALPDLTPVVEDVAAHFRAKEYEVSQSRLANGGRLISVYQGDWFRALLGLKTALNIRIEPAGPEGTRVSAGIGIFELQALPTVITLFVFTPVIFTQIWGILQQQKLDDETVRFIEDRLYRHSTGGEVVVPAEAYRRYAAAAEEEPVEIGTPADAPVESEAVRRANAERAAAERELDEATGRRSGESPS